MEFKHYAFTTVLICSIWALVVVGLTSVDGLNDIRFKTEIPQEESGRGFEIPKVENEYASIVKVLNTALPLAFVAIVLLIITYGTNPIGFGSLVLAIAIFGLATSKTLDKADIIAATTGFSVESEVWWML